MSADRDEAVVEMRRELARRIAAHVRTPGELITAIPGLALYRLTSPTPCYPAAYECSLTVFVQGQKRVTLGKTTYLCDESTFLLLSVELPLVCQIVSASEEAPLLALFLRLNMKVVREILKREEFQTRNGSFPVGPLATGRTLPDLLHPCIRLLDLLNTPADVSFFSDLIHREIVYRLLHYPQGEQLRAIAQFDDPSRGTAKAMAWLRANYRRPFRLDELAAIARMGVSTLEHRFRAVTSLSPLQYQKHLRLFAARERMLVEGLDATRAALEVGYESTSQFTREYKRFFGQPPMRDIKSHQATKATAPPDRPPLDRQQRNP